MSDECNSGLPIPELPIAGYSAVCQVFQDPRDFAKFLGFLRKTAATHGNRFTYTLPDAQLDFSG